MYWKIGEEINSDGTTWLIYNFYEIITFRSNLLYHYNPVTKDEKWIPNKDLVIKAAMSTSEEEFINWYNNHKIL